MCSVVQQMHPNEQSLKGYGKSLLAAVCPAPSSLRTLLHSHASKYPYRSHRCNQSSTCQSWRHFLLSQLACMQCPLLLSVAGQWFQHVTPPVTGIVT